MVQLFPSMGFVSVIIVSALFALGLPMVLLERGRSVSSFAVPFAVAGGQDVGSGVFRLC